MEKNKYYNLCVKAITGDIAPEERIRLDRWLEKSKENQSLYDKIATTWQQTELMDMPIIFDLEPEWIQLKQQLRLENEPFTKKPSVPHFAEIWEKLSEIIRPRLRPAFVVCLTLLIFFTFLYVLKNRAIKPEYLEIFTGNKHQSEYVFSDGSQVQLNSGSSIRFLSTFSDTLREVYLSGEAFFEVIPDKQPFAVVTDYAKTTVLGTQFNVWTRGDQTRVIVKSGKVWFSSLSNQNQSVELIKDQMSWMENGSFPKAPKAINSKYLLGWLDGRLVFEKMPLGEIVNELERTYDISIEINNSELIQQTLTAAFDNLPIEMILSRICLTFGISYRFESDKYVILK